MSQNVRKVSSRGHAAPILRARRCRSRGGGRRGRRRSRGRRRRRRRLAPAAIVDDLFEQAISVTSFKKCFDTDALIYYLH